MTPSVLAGLEPAAVFGWFEALCAIPHGSTRTRAISDFCMEFARARGLRCRQDASNNVLIWKDASPGCEGRPTVILQGHLDMVCEKAAGLRHRFSDRRAAPGGWTGTGFSPEGTTLGGDDGIAVAYALAILDSTDDPAIRRWRLFSQRMRKSACCGAAALEVSGRAKGGSLLNIDSEEEGVLTVSCAGGATCTHLPVPVSVGARRHGQLYRLEVSGLTGRPFRRGDSQGPRQCQ